MHFPSGIHFQVVLLSLSNKILIIPSKNFSSLIFLAIHFSNYTYQVMVTDSIFIYKAIWNVLFMGSEYDIN